jgi:sigma-B regulation protein RsbU (phosphoserine phosphatase)
MRQDIFFKWSVSAKEAATLASSQTFDLPDQLDPHSLQLKQVEELLKLQKAAQKITSILDLDQLIDKIVNDVASSFGCLEASIYLHDQERGEMMLAGVHGCNLQCTGHRLRIGKEGMVGLVASTGQMRYAPDVRLDPYYIACDLSTRSELAIPLHVDGQLVGVFMASHHELDAFPPEQRRVLVALSNYVAVSVHNARRFQLEQQERERMSRDAREARLIQEALLPRSSPYIPGFQISGLSVPAGFVGGDWYDFIPFDDGRVGLVLADVAGKGTAAALLMSATRGVLRSLAGAQCSPGEVLTKLNRLLVEDFPPERFVTMIYGVLDPASRTLTFASAGHLPPLLAWDGEARFLHSEKGLPLGLALGSFSESQVQIPAGSRLLFYSDGITEAVNSAEEEYGACRLQKFILRPETSMEAILEEVGLFADGAGLRDDATVILVTA